MEAIEVTDKSTRKQFLKVPKILYKNDPNWVCPLDRDIESTFDPAENPEFRNGDARRWVLRDSRGKLIGRIAAFFNRDKTNAQEIPVGGVGNFECIDDLGASTLLFDTAKEWLKHNGMEGMDGPVNFGENDHNWGLLVKGFTHPGYGMPYNFPYYKKLFEEYGFRLYFEQYTFHLDLNKEFPERFWKIADWILRKKDFSFRHFRFRETDKFIHDMVRVYNQAWAEFKDNFTPLDPAEVRKTMKKARAIIDEELVWFAYYKDEPIAFFIFFPDVNQILKHMNGKLHLINMIRFLYYKYTHEMTRIRAVVAGVVPGFQGKGIESGIFKHLDKVMEHKKYYEEVELSWVGDFNPKMIALYEAVGGEMAKTHYTYRYLFDPGAEFKRYMPETSKSTDYHKKIRPSG